MGTFRPKAAFELAQTEEQNGNLRVAASHYASVGLYLRRKGKLREARRLLLKAINLHPSSARLYLHLASVEAHLGNVGQSETAMRAFCSTAGVRGKLRDYEAQVLESLAKHPTLSAIYYQKWLEIDRTEPRVLLAAAQVQEKVEDVGAALALLRESFELASNDRKVRVAIRAFLERQLDTVRLHAWDSFEAGKLTREQILSVLRESGGNKLVLSADEPVQPSPKQDRSFTVDKSLSSMIASLENQLGEITGETPKEQEAEQLDGIRPLVDEFRRQADPVLKQDDGSRWDMAHAFAEMGLTEEALEELQKIPPNSEWYAKSLLKQAEIFASQGSLLGALDALQRVLRSEAEQGTHIEAMYQAAHVYYELADMDQAMNMLDMLERASPAYRESRSLRIRVEEFRRKARTGT